MRFRKQAVRKLESPEQLDEIARLTSVPGWLTTLALSVVVLTVGGWSALATVTETVSAPGVLVGASDERPEAVVYAPVPTASLLHPGQAVRLSAAAAPAASAGTLSGTVTAIASAPETEQSLRARLGADHDLAPYLGSGPVTAVTIRLATDPQSPTGLKWSRSGPAFALGPMSPVTAVLDVSAEHPINWLVKR
ncbi:hypothetical protein ACFYW1_03370 [Streptomyces sp. NPDC002669]|uniref:hypothetical protein n=1 Tax=Streptomyces sp. NPDC002669 TaxID=3364658 RepID=UPI003685B1CA